jgi:hypothetical protein
LDRFGDKVVHTGTKTGLTVFFEDAEAAIFSTIALGVQLSKLSTPFLFSYT